MKEKIILIGAGGHAHSCIDVIEQEGRFEIAGLVAHKESSEKTVLGYQVYDNEDLKSLIQQIKNAIVAVGQIKTHDIRMRIFTELKQLDAALPTIVSPRAYVSRHAHIGEGTIVMHGAIVNANARIGVNCIINSQALCEHDVIVNDHCHISTASILNGNCTVGSGSFLGSNSVVKQGTILPEKSVISFGVKHG